jgi:hypothetical protein
LVRCLGRVCFFDVVAEQQTRARQGVTEGPAWATQDEAQTDRGSGNCGGLLITAGTGRHST